MRNFNDDKRLGEYQNFPLNSFILCVMLEKNSFNDLKHR